MKKIIFLFGITLSIIGISCSSIQNNLYHETWYFQNDTINSTFEINTIDTTTFSDYINVILKEIRRSNYYFVLIEKEEFSIEDFEGKIIGLQLSKLPCNFPLKLKPRSKIDIVSSGKTILWIKNRVVVDAFQIID